MNCLFLVLLSFVLCRSDTAVICNATMNGSCGLRYIVIPPVL